MHFHYALLFHVVTLWLFENWLESLRLGFGMIRMGTMSGCSR
jgi:hypothetical protein